MSELTKWQLHEWKPKTIKFDWTPKENNLNQASGVCALVDLLAASPFYVELKKCLPERLSNNSYHPLHFATLLMAGFWMGYDCLDDLEEFAKNPAIVAQFGKIPLAKTFGDYLRDFSEENILALRTLLTRQALYYREALKKDNSITFDMDSTDHEHHGDLIEGLEFNYKGKWCLDSLEVFDELGFCYDFDLRPGATFSSVGSAQMMEKILLHHAMRVPLKDDFARFDSAFCIEEIIRLCLNKKLKATITAHGRIGWQEEVKNIMNWAPWEYRPEEINEAAEMGVPLPKVEVGYYMYAPGFAENIRLPVIVKRTFKAYESLSHKKRAEITKAGQDPKWGLWEYYAVLSLRGLHPQTPQSILEYHQKRGNMENLIREEKISFDLRHFPTKKMHANHAYALLGLMAHNVFRLIGILDNPEHPHYAKHLRRKFIYLPGDFKNWKSHRLIRVSEDSYNPNSRIAIQ
ncbi:MAG: transposase [Pseudobdellovibrionaceae bacterium]